MQREINLVFNAKLKMFNLEDIIRPGGVSPLVLHIQMIDTKKQSKSMTKLLKRVLVHNNIKEVVSTMRAGYYRRTPIHTRNDAMRYIIHRRQVEALYDHYNAHYPSILKLYEEDDHY